jgi:DNA polymerase
VDIVTIDFETYYDRDYSLSKMTTEAYIRDPRFQVIMVGVKINNHETDVFSGAEVGTFLRSMSYKQAAILCHNTAFDGAILSWHYGIKPALWLDTLSMARPTHSVIAGGSLAKLVKHYQLGEKGTEVINALGKRLEDFTTQELKAYAEYCALDVDLTYKLFRKLSKGFPQSELQIIDLVLRMYTEPTIELNRDVLTAHLTDVEASKQALMNRIAGGDEEKFRKVMMSNPMFARLLELLGVDPPMKTSKTTGELTYAFSKTDEEFLALQEHPDPKIQAVVNARLGVKSTLEETRTHSMLEVAARGRLPVMLNYCGAHTGRFSGGDKLNLQNLPKRGGKLALREAMCAPAGYKFVGCDSAQIEARLLAWLAGQSELVDAFRNKRDVYSEFASTVFGRTITSADKTERHVGKTAVLGLGYGMGADRFKSSLKLGKPSVDMELDEAKRVVNIYRNNNFMITGLWRRCDDMLKTMLAGGEGAIHIAVTYDRDGIILPNGMRITYHGLSASDNGFSYFNDARQYAKYARGEDAKKTHIYGGKVTENVVQALAALVIREQMLAAHKAGLKVILQVHDEIVIAVPEDKAEEAEAKLVEIMSTPPMWAKGLPLACESGVSVNYGGV